MLHPTTVEYILCSHRCFTKITLMLGHEPFSTTPKDWNHTEFVYDWNGNNQEIITKLKQKITQY